MADSKSKDPTVWLVSYFVAAIITIVLLGAALNMLMAALPVTVMLIIIGVLAWLYIRERRNFAEYRRNHP